MLQTIRLSAIGWRAWSALAETGGVARVLASLTASTYLDAAGEVLWLGPCDGARHPRAMLAATASPAAGDATPPRPGPAGARMALDFAGLDPWRPRGTSRRDSARLGPGALDLLGALRCRDRAAPRPAGLGVLLVGQALSFPLDRAAGAVRAVADACARDAAADAAAAGEPLIGLGPGLTPSGDDFVGGVLFARRALAPGDAAWSRAATSLVERARTGSHPVSAALVTDLARGEGHEPLHDLMDALASDGARDRALGAIARLGRLGHSSGWDMLTGVLVGLAGPAALDPTSPGGAETA